MTPITLNHLYTLCDSPYELETLDKHVIQAAEILKITNEPDEHGLWRPALTPDDRYHYDLAKKREEIRSRHKNGVQPETLEIKE